MACPSQEEITVLLPDSAVSDTLDLTAGMRLTQGIVIERPPREEPVFISDSGISGVSWLISAMLLLFVTVSLRYRKNTRYLTLILHDIVDVRERHNVFDDTLRETTFLWLLNLLWCGGAGILIFGLMYGGDISSTYTSLDIGRIGICIGIAAAYTLFLTLAYATVGYLFSEDSKSSAWVKGYLATQGLEGIILFPVALLGLCLPSLLGAMATIGFIIFIFAKFLFIYKGFCIFFREIASWVLFLYYLCSLEIVPIVLTYVAAGYLCEIA